MQTDDEKKRLVLNDDYVSKSMRKDLLVEVMNRPINYVLYAMSDIVFAILFDYCFVKLISLKNLIKNKS